MTSILTPVKDAVLRLRRRSGLGGVSTPLWVPRRADGSPVKAFADYVNSRFWYSGTVYLTEAGFNTAVGLSISGAIRQTVTPYQSSGELLSNNGFDANITPWIDHTGTANHPVSWQSPGKLRQTNSSGAQNACIAFYPSQPCVYPKTYRFSVDSIGSFTRSFGLANASFSGVGTIASLLTPGNTHVAYGKLADIGTSGVYFFLRADNTLNGNIAEWDNVSIKEILPFAGWGDGTSFSGFVEGVAGTADPVANETIWSADANVAGGGFSKVYRDTSKVLRFETNRGGTLQASLNLGTLANGAAFKVAFSVAHGDIRAARDGGTQVTGGGSVPETAFMHVNGLGTAAENWPVTGQTKTWCIQ